MIRKIALLFTLMILIAIPVFAVGDIWFSNDPGNNITNDFNLESVYVPFTKNDPQHQNAYRNKLGENYIGSMGFNNCGHAVDLVIEIDGKFVSASDPTKYRNYNIAISSITANSPNDNPSMKAYSSPQDTDPVRLMNTKYQGNTLTISTSGSRAVTWVRMILVLDELSAEDYKHLAEKDDYFATINISWSCSRGCSDHVGSFVLRVKGFYGSAFEAHQDSFVMSVTPNPNASNLDIEEMARTNSSVNIGNITLLSSTRSALDSNTAYPWQDHIFVFASSSPNYLTSNGDFKLVNSRGTSEIGFTITLNDAAGRGTTFTGSKAYTGSTSSEKRAGCLVLDNNSIRIFENGRNSIVASMVEFYGTINIQLESGALSAINSNRTAYTGAYSSAVYIHVIYE